MTKANGKMAYSIPNRYEIALVNHKYNLLVRLFLSDVFRNALAEYAERIPCIQYM